MVSKRSALLVAERSSQLGSPHVGAAGEVAALDLLHVPLPGPHLLGGRHEDTSCR
jgi:hypothetical protein